MKKSVSLLLSSLAIAAGFISTPVLAGPVITSWEYTLNAVFDPVATFTAGTGTTSVTDPLISWGRSGGNLSPIVNNQRSGIGINNTGNAGVINTNGGAVGITTYTHYNSNDIGAGASTLRNATVNSTLSLFSTAPVGGVTFGPVTQPYSIQFSETPNTTGTCVVASTTPCDDIFVISGLLNNALDIDGNIYFISFFEQGGQLQQLSDPICTAAGAALGCIGFTTAEGANTSFQFAFQITTAPIGVPEPSSMALAGLGLAAVGMAGASRRRRNANKTA
jgi:hypothetical protein